MYFTWEKIVLILIAILGGLYDLKFRKIPNWLTFGTFIFILVLRIFFFKNFNLVIDSTFGFFIGITLLIIPYIFGGMGAGDVKFLGAIGSIVGVKNIVYVFFYSALSGLVLGLIWLMFNPERLKFLITTGHILPTVDNKQKIPYGIAISLGTLIYIVFGSNIFFSILLLK